MINIYNKTDYKMEQIGQMIDLIDEYPTGNYKLSVEDSTGNITIICCKKKILTKQTKYEFKYKE